MRLRRMPVCLRCGRGLGLDPDDDPPGAPDELPLCGDCVRAQAPSDDHQIDDHEILDFLDGELDGVIEW